MRGRSGAVALLCLLACSAEAPKPVAPLAEPTRDASASSSSEEAKDAEVLDADPPDADLPDAAPPPPAPRLTSTGYTTWIFGRPKADERFIGYIRFGTSVALRSRELVRGEGCSGGFYAIEPRGYVCNNHTVTSDPSARFVELAMLISQTSGPLPYGYAFSDGAPMYNRLPTEAEQKRAERKLVQRRSTAKKPAPKKPLKHRSTYEDLLDEGPIPPRDPIPEPLTEHAKLGEQRHGLVRETIPPGSMLAFTKAFAAEGRTWLLSTDLTLVPADRTRPFRKSEFHGVRLDDQTKLPLAWIRGSEKPKMRRGEGEGLEPSGGSWPVQSFVGLTGGAATMGRTRYLETREADTAGRTLFIAEKDATVVEAMKPLGDGVSSSQKSIVVSIGRGTLVAYEGTTPVFATLISPGRGGIPTPGNDPVEDSTTPLGSYAITFKDRAATMSPDKPGEPRRHWIADVPHTQYFKPPFALHAAYWHDRFGMPASGGCINLSPIDAELLFDWSDPQVPQEWQGAAGAGVPENGRTTIVIVRR